MGLERLVPELVIAGKWRLRRRIGRGGMGEVWVALHKSLDQEVAIKALDSDAFGLELIEEARSRFHLEAQVAADLSRRTRHIASVMDHGNDNGLDYLVMELLVGESLEDLLQRDGRMEPARVAEVIRQAARGLAIAHRDNVVHRDLKPANIFLTKDDEGALLVKLLDFGIAKARPRISNVPPSSHRTRAGVLLGTAAYMSPEQARGLEVDTRIDVWALSCVAYELLTGAMAYLGETDIDLLMKICTTQPAPPSSLVAELTPEVDAVFARAFASKLDDRWPDARAFADVLATALTPVRPAQPVNSDVAVVATPPPMPVLVPQSRKRPVIAIAAGVALIGVGVLILATRSKPVEPAAAAPPPPATTTVEPTKPPVTVASPATSPAVSSTASATTKKPTKTKATPSTSASATANTKKVDQGEIF
jgi:eukaryotic-like serine/threonine-protein kinase